VLGLLHWNWNWQVCACLPHVVKLLKVVGLLKAFTYHLSQMPPLNFLKVYEGSDRGGYHDHDRKSFQRSKSAGRYVKSAGTSVQVRSLRLIEDKPHFGFLVASSHP